MARKRFTPEQVINKLREAEVGTESEIEYFGRRHRARVNREPLFDPKSERLRG